MAILLNPKENQDLNFHLINENLNKLENILKKNEIYNKQEFIEWRKDFEKIYGKKHTNLHLYVVFLLIYSISHIFISKFILTNKILLKNNKITYNLIREIERDVKLKYKKLNIFWFRYFNPFFSLSEKEDLNFFYNLVFNLSDYVFKLNLKPEYTFDYLIQKIISPLIRHKSGEYFTPPFLAKRMVEESYSFGEAILDPCCGSGNFLSEVVKNILSQNEPKEKKIEAINMVFGYDINPISIYISKINLLYLLKDLISEIKFNLYVSNSLFQVNNNFKEKFDLVIGNPPWYTYRDIESVDYQDKVKILAEELEIKPLPKNLLNLEISTLFFNKAKESFVKDDGIIFFVITKGVITGSHASRFRNFIGFSDVKIWTFDKKIENIFNIDFICLFGQKRRENFENSINEIKSYHFTLKNEFDGVDYFKPIELKLDKLIPLVPYSIEKKGGKVFTRKLISKENIKNLLPLSESYYKRLFHKGADLNPRNLIFVKFKNVTGNSGKINPDMRIFKRAKAPWNKKEFENVIVEKDYIFKVIKSTELVKFHVYNYYDVFLPLKKSDLSFTYDSLENHAKLFYDKINEIYKKYKKVTTKHEALMDNLNRWSKLINLRQKSKIKVVYNNSGSILNAAVIQGDYLITGDLCFYAAKNLEEAHYLSAILNSTMITKQIKIVKSSRHIFKLPLDVPIKKFEVNNANHQKLTELGKKGQSIAKKIIKAYTENNTSNPTKFKIQSLLSENLKRIFSQIDEILIRELRNN
ncbi:MAG: N-6 DNA methylase [Candidatus Lokiarchaeota archaeon]|nr:N-6 DNA methylase [Candidatus Lokiarchaeota archaeon]